jgi:hypothetical protein
VWIDAPVRCAVTGAVRQVRTVFKEYRHPLSKIFEHYAALDNVRSCPSASPAPVPVPQRLSVP